MIMHRVMHIKTNDKCFRMLPDVFIEQLVYPTINAFNKLILHFKILSFVINDYTTNSLINFIIINCITYLLLIFFKIQTTIRTLLCNNALLCYTN
ncbi:hypothetical protein KM92DES2_12840 [uncultured Desulfovibrio sp.]|uniref:Uncharacterized protein n=1 Tax=uncultured Desulfovibrio sp. TaxID=167968 RepID=A0A212KED7_9BACT|nr:hypothetical protein KM92DES2_12840 [uncultured Desulfovibrio sp.]